jgi:hypothetical protein
VGMSRRLAEAATRRVVVLVVEVPGWAATRYAAERAVRERGWRPALSPADADVLLTCGTPGPRLADALELVWAQLPGPRARVGATARSGVDAALERAAAELVDTGSQRADAVQRSADPVMGTPAAGQDDDHDSGAAGSGEDHSDEDHSDEDEHHGDMDHGDMDHGDMDMAPHGVPLAGAAADRDGLELDALHLPLGPVLPCWPAGLLLHCTLGGDVVTDVRPEVLGPDEDAVPDPPSPRAPAVDRLDRAARLLALAGWEAAATDAIRMRDALLDGDDGVAVAARVDRLADRVRRSRLLRWSLRGAGPIDADACRDLGLGDRAAGDVHHRLVALLSDVRSALHGGALPPAVPLDVLPRLLPGLELGAVRLLVASLDLDTEARTSAGAAP